MDVAQNYKLDLQKPQILYISGAPDSHKKAQCERLVRDFKFEQISMGNLIITEIHNKTQDGTRLHQFVAAQKDIPTELVVQVLSKAIKSRKAKRFLILDFPRGQEQALYVEQNFREIDLILNIVIPEDILLERITKRTISEGLSQTTEEISDLLKSQMDPINELISTYSKLGKVANIHGLGDVEEIYSRVRQAILPNLIFFYGAPSTGRSEVAQEICKLTGYKYLHLENFYSVNACKTDVEKINKLMKFFLETSDRNYIIDSFLDNKASAIVFFEHFGKPRNVFYFQSAKDEIDQNIRKYSKSEEEKKQRLSSLKIFLKNRDELIGFFSQFQFFVVINAIDNLKNIENKILDHIRPKVLVALTYNNQDLADDYIQKLVTQEGFMHLPVDVLCEEELQRGSSLGMQISAFIQSGQTVPAKMQIELLRKIFFQNPLNNKFILTSFPEKKIDFELFEQNFFPVDGLLNFLKPDQNISYSAKINPSLHFISENKNLKIHNDDLGVFRAYMTKRTKYGIVVGPSKSGRTTLAKFISQKYGYTLIEWEPTIAQLKEKLGQPNEPLDELPLVKIIEYYKKLFDQVLDEKFVFDGFPPVLCETKQQMLSLLEIGQPTWILANSITKDALWKRFKLISELDAAQELSPEDDEKILLIQQTGDQNTAILHDYVRIQSDCKLYQLNVNHSLDYTQQAIDQIYQKRIFLARNQLVKPTHEQVQGLRLVFINVAAQKNMTFVDVEALLNRKKSNLSMEFGMRQTDLPVDFPSNYNPASVVKLIQSYLASTSIDNRDVLIWGYPSADSQIDRNYEETMFPRVSDEIVSVEKLLGPIRIVQIITDKQLSNEIEDPEWELVKPIEKPKVLDGDGVEIPSEDPEDNKPKYNIHDWRWTRSDGYPKNIAQIYTQLKKPQAETIEVSEYSYKMIFDQFNVFLEKVNEDHSANFLVQIQVHAE